jgi:hypothetical protein
VQLICNSLSSQGLGEYPEKRVSGGVPTYQPLVVSCPDDYAIVGLENEMDGMRLICSRVDLSLDNNVSDLIVRSSKIPFWTPYSNDAGQSASLQNHMAGTGNPAVYTMLPQGTMMVGVNIDEQVEPYFDENQLLYQWSIWGVKTKKTY